MSFGVDREGKMYVLDQNNGRVVRYGKDGKPEKTIPMDRPNGQDVAFTKNGVAVLDRFGGQDVALYDENGTQIGSLPLEGEGVETAGHVTGLFVDGDDVYAEVEHGPLVKVGDTAGNPASPRETIPGRPSRDGHSYLSAGIIDAPSGRTYVASNVRPGGEHKFTRELRFGAPTYQLLLLDTDASGTIYFAAEVEEEGGGSAIVSLLCLDRDTGAPTGSATLPANTTPEESFKDFAVLDEGGVVYEHRTPEGVTFEKYVCE